MLATLILHIRQVTLGSGWISRALAGRMFAMMRVPSKNTKIVLSKVLLAMLMLPTPMKICLLRVTLGRLTTVISAALWDGLHLHNAVAMGEEM